MTPPHGKYIVIEGHDGVGKSTQIELLAEYFRKQGKKVLTTKEPGGGIPSVDDIRKILKDKSYNLEDITNVLLFTANRCELWQKVIEPALAQGQIVISDRNWWSTLAYECSGMGVDKHLVTDLTTQCLPKRYVKPDFGVILALDEAERIKRINIRDNITRTDAFESRPDDFQKRVAEGYAEIAKEYRISTIDAAPSPEEIHKQIIACIFPQTRL